MSKGASCEVRYNRPFIPAKVGRYLYRDQLTQEEFNASKKL
jgi:hypothetical protein